MLPQPRIYHITIFINDVHVYVFRKKIALSYAFYYQYITDRAYMEALLIFYVISALMFNGWLQETVNNLTQSANCIVICIPTILHGICTIKLHIITVLIISVLNDIHHSNCDVGESYWNDTCWSENIVYLHLVVEKSDVLEWNIEFQCKRQRAFHCRV